MLRTISGDEAPLIEAEVRDAEAHLSAAGMELVLEDLAQRAVPPAYAAVEAEFAWWASAYDAIAAAAPELTEYGAIGAAISRFLDRDREFGEARIGPLLRAVGEQRRLATARNQDEARDLFSVLVEGGDGPYSGLWERFPTLVRSLRPVAIASAEQVSELVPSQRVIDTVVLIGIESLSFAESVPAIARANQVVVLADPNVATASAAEVLGELLPTIELPSLPQPRDPRVTAVLAEHCYGDAIEALPAVESGTLAWIPVEAVGPVGHSPGVETTTEEVAAVLEQATRIARDHPSDALAVVAGNAVHAAAIHQAAETVSGLPARFSVVELGHTGGLDADSVILSLGYGPDESDQFPESLGYLAGPNGSLGVVQALVAARRDVRVVTTLSPEYLSWAAREANTGHGIDALADLIALASTPPIQASGDDDANWVMRDIAARLRERGVHAEVALGSNGTRIPLAVGASIEDPLTTAVITDDERPSGNESLRDHLRHGFARLQALGWSVVPLWTLDAFMDPDAAAAELLRAVGVEPLQSSELDSLPPPAVAPSEPIVPLRSSDDSDIGWGEHPGDSRDDELRRDVPPHWS